MATSKSPAKKTAPASAAKSKAVAKTAAKKAPAKKPAVAAPAKKAAPVKKPAAAKKPAAKSTAASAGKNTLTPEQRYMMVAEAAYYRAERQGFMGDPAQDWVAAEADIAALLKRQK